MKIKEINLKCWIMIMWCSHMRLGHTSADKEHDQKEFSQNLNVFFFVSDVFMILSVSCK